MIPLTHHEQLNYEKRKYCHLCKEKFYEEEQYGMHQEKHGQIYNI